MFCSSKSSLCAHGRKNNGTCYNKFELLLIVEEIEKKEGRQLRFLKDKSIIHLWEDINAYMKSKYNCQDELCWVETLKLDNLEKSAFKPIMPDEWVECDISRAPENKCMNTWLSNYEIDNVLEQFQNNIENFEYLGSVPIDFAKLSNKKINSFRLKEAINKRKNKIGVVFNTDPSFRGGQHWICAFIDLENNEINFFDSYGSNGNYPEEIQAFFSKVIEEAKLLNISLNIKTNVVRHQFKNSECGVYCLKFIADRLTKDFESLVKVPIPDDVVNKERWTRFFRVKSCRNINT